MRKDYFRDFHLRPKVGAFNRIFRKYIHCEDLLW